ncbi:hypothetical protein VOLCADRAFT_116527 [Volvox carteri f. nagariensis]|uniref:Nucleotide exchange factor Fes1 domain-containing protein n=1 Tax=Volvox carteri f. nagariensis TaxID=3068 RepID=D8TMS9_VOLCA|nr:uncharacterized protein VOLCADRAFT_116527 [Volvox carteri f. nagariensis]EFJ51306.1 hypothetical protein VOLCADRAFT_116527 [Volvox carteri f. nagariensis]|eukprot:XP_002947773.1 hypothetical protein VOLCADRAFT_116527 [Volvox carteri f. nagariensis]
MERYVPTSSKDQFWLGSHIRLIFYESRRLDAATICPCRQRLWDWSLKYADGTSPSGFRPEDVDPEKMKWLDDVLKHYMVDFSARMKEIKTALEKDTSASGAGVESDQGPAAGGDVGDSGGAGLEEREALLEELMDIVSSIDYARDLHKIGGLPVLLELLASPQPSLQWRAAEVVATCVANNPPVQQWFLDGGVLPRLLDLAAPSQPHGTVRTKALLALSGLVRHFGPGLEALREAGGLVLLVGSLGAADRRIARKAMTLLTYMLTQRRADCAAAVAGGALPPLVAELELHAAPDGDNDGSAAEASDMRQAALSALIQLASYPSTWAAVRDAPGLQARLAVLAAAHAALPADVAEAQAEEGLLVQQLTALLAAAAPPAGRPDELDHVSVEAFEEAGRGTTFAVNEPQPVAVTVAVRDAGAGHEDQGGGTATMTMTVAGRGGAEGSTAGSGDPAAGRPPLLLGAP